MFLQSLSYDLDVEIDQQKARHINLNYQRYYDLLVIEIEILSDRKYEGSQVP